MTSTRTSNRTCSDCGHNEHEGRCGTVVELGVPSVRDIVGHTSRGRATCGCTGSGDDSDVDVDYDDEDNEDD
jgi:hypothetical protein